MVVVKFSFVGCFVYVFIVVSGVEWGGFFGRGGCVVVVCWGIL